MGQQGQKKRQKGQQPLRQWQEVLPQLLRAGQWVTLGEALPSVIHELNNALNSVVGFAELWRSDEQLPKELRDDLTEIFHAGLRARELLSTLRESVRGVSEAPLLTKVVLPEICDQALMLLAASLRRYRLQAICDYHPQTPSVLSDPVRALFIVLSLLQNACDAAALSEKGSRITLRTYGDETGAAVLWVEDDGPGIAPAVQKCLFEPFNTTKPEGKGTGLGLTLVHHFVKELQGEIEIVSREGIGTRVIVQIPDLSSKG